MACKLIDFSILRGLWNHQFLEATKPKKNLIKLFCRNPELRPIWDSGLKTRLRFVLTPHPKPKSWLSRQLEWKSLEDGKQGISRVQDPQWHPCSGLFPPQRAPLGNLKKASGIQGNSVHSILGLLSPPFREFLLPFLWSSAFQPVDTCVLSSTPVHRTAVITRQWTSGFRTLGTRSALAYGLVAQDHWCSLRFPKSNYFISWYISRNCLRDKQ